MPKDNDAYWDEMGVAWRATAPDPGLLASKLEARLRGQAMLSGAGTAACLVAGVAGATLAAWCEWVAYSAHAPNFMTRGVAIGAVAVLLLMAAATLGGRITAQAGSLRETLELARSRAERLARAAALGCVAVAVLAIGGLAGYWIRVHLSRPPAMSPVEALLALAVLGLVLLWIRQGQRQALASYGRLAQALELED
ncbi:MAG TPA: hypothetical protein VHX64_00210 [Caulobacteraceae bacterium]|nr:hypothetical protein [Caulobacteraceae bacterium]